MVQPVVPNQDLPVVQYQNLGLGALWNPPSWARKVLICHHNQVMRSVSSQFFLLGGPVSGMRSMERALLWESWGSFFLL